MDIAHLIVLVGSLAIGAQWIAWRLQWPAIVLLMLFGLTIGPALGLIHPQAQFGDNFYILIELCVALILFEGGMNLRWHELKDVSHGILRLILVAVPLSLLFTSLAGIFIGELSLPVAVVFGAITVVTGPTVIMPLLRHTSLTRRSSVCLKWEGIINDPIGALLAVTLLNYFLAQDSGLSPWWTVLYLSKGLLIGALIGWGTAKLMAQLLIRGTIPEFLKPLVLLVSVFLVDQTANLVGVNVGLVATTVYGLILGNSRLPDLISLRRFKETITLLLVSSLFILLSANIQLDLLDVLNWQCFALLACIIFIIRPLTIFLSTLKSDISWQERTLLAWIAPRGIVAAAVSAVFGPQLEQAGFAGAELLLPVTFLLILFTVVLHGFSINKFAQFLGLATESKNGLLIVGVNSWTIDLAKALIDLKIQVLLVDFSWEKLRPARLAGIPVYYGELLSEGEEQSIDFSHIGHLLACSENEAYNSLVCSHFINEFGRERVFQLPTSGSEAQEEKDVHHSLRGQFLSAPQTQYSEIMKRFYYGWRFQKTKLTETYTPENYTIEVKQCDGIPVIAINKQGALRLISHDKKFQFSTEESVIAYMPPR